ncbi:MAG: thioredoxin family protein [Candidatus Aenigmarchaeota archaeon]|nr:thioredoxin family protein [Candidatus Aenigmarchaeota archaeon]
MKTELVVFGIIAAFVVAGAFLVNIPQGQLSLPNLGKAPEFSGISGYINTEPGLTLESLRGKVVLVDFWTYSCINCIRTLPYLNAWHEKYKDQGLVIVGVHTPEFAFEREYGNVKAAVEKYGIEYAVVQDNDYATWNAYDNKYWPRKYLVDAQGNIRYDHIGEGAYEETEAAIQALLKERDASLDVSGMVKPNATEVNFTQVLTPELYFGYQFARQPLGSPEAFKPEETVNYSIPDNISPNAIYLEGSWKNNEDNMELVSQDGRILLAYYARAVNIVAGSGVGNELEIKLDGDYVDAGSKGSDIAIEGGRSISTIDSHRLYNLVFSNSYDAHMVEIKAGQGFRIYTFTFG